MSASDSEPASVPTTPGSDASGSGGAGTGRQKRVVFLVVAVLSLIADQATKVWARESLPTARLRGGNAICIVPDDLVRSPPPAAPGQPSDPRPACAGTAVPVISGFWEWRLSMNPGSA